MLNFLIVSGSLLVLAVIWALRLALPQPPRCQRPLNTCHLHKGAAPWRNGKIQLAS